MAGQLHRARRVASRPLAALIGCIGIFLLSAAPAHAAKIYFGTQEYLRYIQDVGFKGPNGENVYLGYKYSFHSFILPYEMSDDGYILGVKGKDQYYRLDAGHIAQYQARGELPAPLPKYELSWIDYAMGHGLWVFLGGMAIYFVVLVVKQKGAQKRRELARPFFASAFEHDQHGDATRAIIDYSKAIEADPKFDAAFINRGRNYQRRGDDDRAIADFTRAIKIGSKEMRVHGLINRGLALQQKGDLDRAIANFTLAIKQSQAAAAYFRRGSALELKGDFAKAIADYSKAIALDPASAAVLQARGNAYAKQGDGLRAQADFEAARDLAARQGAPVG